jgi:hypothetical protein
MKSSIPGRILLLLTGVLAAYQVSVGIDGLATLPIIAYTVGFGVLLVAALLLIILGFEVLSSPVVVIISSIIPLSLSLGLVWEYLPGLSPIYFVFVLAGFAAILTTRWLAPAGKLSIAALAIFHGISGLVIFLLPLMLALQGEMSPAFALVGVGGALIGLAGLLLSFLKAGRPILSQDTIYKMLPAILLLMTACFVAGSKYG